jgi:mycoredoxin
MKEPAMNTVKVYGADWCGDTRNTRNHLDSLGVQYQYLDVDSDPAAKEWMLEQNGGKQKLPTVAINGEVLAIPDEIDLEAALRNNGLMA